VDPVDPDSDSDPEHCSQHCHLQMKVAYSGHKITGLIQMRIVDVYGTNMDSCVHISWKNYEV
jgi:hypothetical protein